MSLAIPGMAGMTCLRTGSSLTSLRSVVTAGLTSTRPATRSGWSAASRRARAPPIESPQTTTVSTWLASASKARVTSAYQSAQVVRFISCQVVPWPGRRGSDTAYPWAARCSAHGFIDAGDPVNPWLSRTPMRPLGDPGSPSETKGSASWWTDKGTLLAVPLRASRGGCGNRVTRSHDGLVSYRAREKEVAQLFYWFLKWIALGPLLRVVFRPRVEGAENIPDEGAAILASNHLSYA